MKFEDLITKAELNPKKLFLIDGFGAILSAFLLGFVLVRFEEVFGIPSSVLHYLAVIPLFFVLYNLYSYKKAPLNTGLFLMGIAVLNLLYCFVAIGLVSKNVNSITSLGWAYIIAEILLISVLALIEFRVGRNVLKATMN